MAITLPDAVRPEPGLPVPGYWTAHLAAAPDGTEPAGGGERLLRAACGYFTRRGLWSAPGQVLAAPGAEALLLGLLAAAGGEPVLARPAPAWQGAVAGLAGRQAHTVQSGAEGGAVPDPFALLEAVRRARAAGGDPRLLVLAAADDPTGTVTAPELLHETCEAAAEAGLQLVSDETYSGTLHHRDTVLLSPAEMLPDHTVVLADLGATLVPAGVPVALARFPGTALGTAWRERTAAALAALRALLPAPVAAAARYVLGEPAEVVERAAAANRLHARTAAAAYRAVTGTGAVCRPPQAGFQLYPTLRNPDLGARALEERLTAALGRPVPGGHRFGDDPAEPRARIDTGALHGTTEAERRAALEAADPLAVPHVAAALDALASAFAALTAPDPVSGSADAGSRGRAG